VGEWISEGGREEGRQGGGDGGVQVLEGRGGGGRS